MSVRDGAAYGLGVSVGIAECQAKVGESARIVVISSLEQANSFARP